MAIVNTYSTKSEASDAVDEVLESFNDHQTKMVLYFASSNYSPSELANLMKKAFPDAEVFGCTTSGELTSGKLLKNSLVVMGFDDEEVEDVKVGLIDEIKEKDNVKKVFDEFADHFGKSVSDLDIDKYVGIILFDGMSGAEEKIMDSIGDMSNLTVIGGSAGDDMKFKETHVFVNGKAYSNAAVLTLIKVKKGFDIIKTQSFDVTDKKFVATKVDEPTRTIVEINKCPAAEYYADLIGTKPDQVADHFMENPVGLVAGGEPFVRSPQQSDGKSITFYCQVKEGTELSLLQSTDIVKDTEKVVKAKVKELGGVSAIINFHCILRTLELEAKKQTEDYGKIFDDIPMIGFSTYGEEYIGHINQTSTMLVFK